MDENWRVSHKWRAKLKTKEIFLIQPPQPPYPLPRPPLNHLEVLTLPINRLCNQPQYTNFANFGPIWMKLGVEVKNGQQSSNPELFFDSTHLTPPTTLPIPP